MTTKYDDIRAAVTAKLMDVGVTYKASYVGAIEKRQEGAKPWECDQWRIEFTRVGAAFVTDYFTGIGHRKPKGYDAVLLKRELIEHHHSHHPALRAKYAHPVAPDAASVLNSMCMEGEAINESFSNWCDNFGYDSDSIKAINTYRECEKIGREMRAFFGSAVVAELAEIVREL